MRNSLILLLCLVFGSCQSRQPIAASRPDAKGGGTTAASVAATPAVSPAADTSSPAPTAAAPEQNRKNDTAPVLYPVKVDGKYGYIDRQGKLVLPATFSGASRFAEGMAAVQLKKADRVGFIDETGKISIPLQFDLADPFSEGLAAVMKDHKWGYIDKTGQIVIPTMFDNALRFSEGVAAVADNTNSMAGYSYINRKGEPALSTNFKFDTAFPFNEGLAAVRSMGQAIRFIDHSGKTVIPPQFAGATEFGEGLVPVQVRAPEGMRWEYVGKNGKQAFPAYFYRAFPFTEGLAAVQVASGKWGFINTKGTMVIDPKFDSVADFYKGLAQAYVGEALGYIDSTGKYVWEPKK